MIDHPVAPDDDLTQKRQQFGWINWPAGAGQRSLGLCFTNEDPDAIVGLTRDHAAVMVSIFEAAAERDALAARLERAEAERDAMRPVVEALPALIGLWQATLNATSVEPTEAQIAAGYAELVDIETSHAIDNALEAIEPFEKILFTYRAATPSTPEGP